MIEAKESGELIVFTLNFEIREVKDALNMLYYGHNSSEHAGEIFELQCKQQALERQLREVILNSIEN